ncbi:unnamed protein product [Periconia digitata]|uniref:Uncharacterized protein n=1 Tax=Periconia digitata TaxID=1303443 RepID=A0A9W4UE53_9PLEO|nr:unnamed protein product [Periconia digitata]
MHCMPPVNFPRAQNLRMAPPHVLAPLSLFHLKQKAIILLDLGTNHSKPKHEINSGFFSREKKLYACLGSERAEQINPSPR